MLMIMPTTNVAAINSKYNRETVLWSITRSTLVGFTRKICRRDETQQTYYCVWHCTINGGIDCYVAQYDLTISPLRCE